MQNRLVLRSSSDDYVVLLYIVFDIVCVYYLKALAKEEVKLKCMT